MTRRDRRARRDAALVGGPGRVPSIAAKPAASKSVWQRIDPSLRWIGVAVACTYGLLMVVGLASLHSGQPVVRRGSWAGSLGSGGEPWSEFLSMWQRWDALWYQRIIEQGYAAGDGTAAFYPLYPLLSRAASFLFGGHVVWGELAVAATCTVAALWLLYKVVTSLVTPAGSTPGSKESRLLRQVPAVTVLYVLLFPTGFFFLAPYTESLFLLTTLAAFWFARTGHPWKAGAMGFLAGLTRTQGVFMVLPLAIEYLAQGGRWEWIRGRGGSRPGFAVVAAALPFAGYLAFAAYLRFVVQEPSAGLELQARWDYRVVFPWQSVADSLAHIGRGGVNSNEPAIEALNLAAIVGFTGLAVVVTRRLPLSFTAYVWPSILLLYGREMFFSPLMAVSRYMIVLFPCFIALALVSARYPVLPVILLPAAALAQLLLFQFWVRFGFVA